MADGATPADHRDDPQAAREPQVIGHWRVECVTVHNAVILAYRRSMQKIDLDRLWRMAVKLVVASFRDHGEPVPSLPSSCPFFLDALLDPELDLEALVTAVAGGRGCVQPSSPSSGR